MYAGIERCLKVIDKVNEWVARIATYGAIPIGLIILYEVIVRFLFNSPTKWGFEVTSNLFGYYLIVGGGYLVLIRGHIRVDVFWSRLSPRAAAVVDLATSWLAFLFVGAVLWTSPELAWDSFQVREHNATTFGSPVYPSKMLIVVGMALVFLQLVAKFIRDLRTVTRGVEA